MGGREHKPHHRSTPESSSGSEREAGSRDDATTRAADLAIQRIIGNPEMERDAADAKSMRLLIQRHAQEFQTTFAHATAECLAAFLLVGEERKLDKDQLGTAKWVVGQVLSAGVRKGLGLLTHVVVEAVGGGLVEAALDVTKEAAEAIDALGSEAVDEKRLLEAIARGSKHIADKVGTAFEENVGAKDDATLAALYRRVRQTELGIRPSERMADGPETGSIEHGVEVHLLEQKLGGPVVGGQAARAIAIEMLDRYMGARIRLFPTVREKVNAVHEALQAPAHELVPQAEKGLGYETDAVKDANERGRVERR